MTTITTSNFQKGSDYTLTHLYINIYTLTHTEEIRTTDAHILTANMPPPYQYTHIVISGLYMVIRAENSAEKLARNSCGLYDAPTLR